MIRTWEKYLSLVYCIVFFKVKFGKDMKLTANTANSFKNMVMVWIFDDKCYF